MCGILGLITPHKPVELLACHEGCEAISHRGPDGYGVVAGRTHSRDANFLNNPSKQLVGSLGKKGPDFFLGHRRLAVIDLADAAAQPMSNETDSLWVVFNGEIYNFVELRCELAGLGHRFKTDHSDTEVLVHGYEQWGERVVDRLRGMFAFAVLDLEANRLFLARDRFGEKPLYYHLSADGVAFCSELKGLLQIPNIVGSVSQQSVFAFLHHGFVPAPMSIFENVKKLKAAEQITIDLDSPRNAAPRTYWDLQYEPDYQKTRSQWAEEFAGALGESVALRTISDVPLGTFLSGGIDSTVVTGQVSRLSTKPVQAFSVGFPMASHDEREYSTLAAEKFGLHHHIEVVEPESLLATVPRIAEIFDEPFADSSAIPTLAVSRLARQHVTVALSGDGGDELLAGYGRYRLQQQISRILDWQPQWFVKMFFGAARRCWPQHVRGSGLLKQFIPGRKARYFSLFSDDYLLSLATADYPGAEAGIPEDTWPQNATEPIDAMCSFDRRFYIPEDLMVKVDRTSMSVSLEARAPLLDHILFELSSRMPLELKFDGAQGKLPFKRLLAKDFDESFVNRPKRGFAVPLGKWFRGDLYNEFNDVLLGRNGFVRSIIPAKCIERLIGGHVKGSRDQSPRLWKLYVLEKWYSQYGILASNTDGCPHNTTRVA
ncbi:MAG: asparagine synthase (glutamine-hydrolyzing) [Pirellulales bacterium]|nr:asparagine synthase (glutamine-hydrolyzing) [Pirellulales bacterium]